jgi:endonuclease YncB( thermonuclease family)
MRYATLLLCLFVICGCDYVSKRTSSHDEGTDNQEVTPPNEATKGSDARVPDTKSSSSSSQKDSGSTKDRKYSSSTADGIYRCGRILDGHTLELEKAGAVALAGISAPAADQPGGVQTMRELQQAVAGRDVTVEFCPAHPKNDKDQYRVIIAYRDQSGKMRNLNQLMLRQGLARLRADESCHIQLADWQQYEKFARENRKGLWKTVWLNEADLPPAGPGTDSRTATPDSTQPPANSR